MAGARSRRRIRVSSSASEASCCSARATPANDMIGEGLIGRRVQRRVAPRCRARRVTFDYETPNRALGIPATTVVDGTNELAPRQRARRAALRRRASAGAGTGSPVSATPTSSRRLERHRPARGRRHVRHRDDRRRRAARVRGRRRCTASSSSRWLLDTTLTIEHHDTRLRARRPRLGRARHDRLAVGLRHRHRRELPVLAAATPRARCAAARRGSGPSARRASRRGPGARRGCAGAAAPGSARAGSAGRSRRT